MKLDDKRSYAMHMANVLGAMGYMIEVTPEELRTGFSEAWCDNVVSACERLHTALTANALYYGWQGVSAVAWKQLHEDVPEPAPGILIYPRFDIDKVLESEK